MSELVVTPPLEPTENRMKAPVRMRLQQTKNLDITRITDLLRQIGRIEDVFWLEERIFLLLTQETEIHRSLVVFERSVDETGMPLSLSLALATLVALAIQAVIHVVTLYWAWIGSGWSLWRRIHYTAFGIVFAFAMLGLGQLGGIGASVYGS